MAVSPNPAARGRWLVPALIVVVSLTVGGGLLAREIYRQPASESGANVVLPTSSSLAPDQQPGSAAVALTPDAAVHPNNDEVRQLLQNFFDSINARDYELWRSTVIRARSQAKPKVEWLKEYRSTRDGSILMHRIDSLGSGDLQVLVSFTSTQSLEDSPPDLQEPCIRWHLSLPLTVEDGGWRLDAVPVGTVPIKSKCT